MDKTLKSQSGKRNTLLMSIKRNKNVKSASGRFGDYVYYTYKKTQQIYSRVYCYPKLTDRHAENGQKVKVAAILWKELNSNFKNDLQKYAEIYMKQQINENKIHLTAYNVFCKCVLKIPFVICNLRELREVAGENISVWMEKGYLVMLNSCYSFKAEINV